MEKEAHKYKGIDFRKYNDSILGRDLPTISVMSARIIIDAGKWEKVKGQFYVTETIPLKRKKI